MRTRLLVLGQTFAVLWIPMAVSACQPERGTDGAADEGAWADSHVPWRDRYEECAPINVGQKGRTLPGRPNKCGPPAVRQVTVGLAHTCALSVDGHLKCWGMNANGELGLGDIRNRGGGRGQMGKKLPAVDLGSGRKPVQISAGLDHTCALTDDGHVVCWGANGDGQLGQGTRANVGDQPDEMGDHLAAVDLGTGRTAVQVSAGYSHTCALLDDEHVKCWGANADGVLGQGDTTDRGGGPEEMGDALLEIDLGAGAAVSQIASGARHACALLKDGRVKCWGANTNGELGQGDAASRGAHPNEMGDTLLAIDLGTGRKAVQISAGNALTCALLDDATVKCWGANSFGELGQGDINRRGVHANEMGDRLPAIDLGTGATAVQISAGPGHVCALLGDARIKCWGSNTFGELGQGDLQRRGDNPDEMGDRLVPVDLGKVETSVQVAASSLHTCAVLTNGGLKCWGANIVGELGQGDTDRRGDDPGEMGDRLHYEPVF